jgi:hypothetical protein
MSEILSEKRETVSFQVLKEMLPNEMCYNAVLKTYSNSFYQNEELDDSVYERYFNATPPTPLSDEEKKELFESLGNRYIKNHYSTDTLRTFLNKEPQQKKGRIE